MRASPLRSKHRGQRKERGKEADNGHHAQQHANQRLPGRGQKSSPASAGARTKIWSRASIIVYAPSPAVAAALAAAASAAPWPWRRPWPSPLPARIHGGRLGGMNLVIIFVRLSQLPAVEQQPAKTVRRAQLKLGIHLDRFKGTNLDANLATHADGNINVEARRIKLRFAQGIRLFVLGSSR
jgi:hypothetical protein